MRMKQLIAVGIASALGGVSPVMASKSGGTSGGEVLNIPVGTRAVGMGEAYTAMADDSSSLYWNPAGIAILNQSEASFMYNQWLKDLTFNTGAVAVPLENGGIGASFSYLSYGNIDGFDALGNPTGNVSAYSGVATVGAGWFGDIWSAGFNLKGIQGELADEKATAFAADLGVTAVSPKEFLGGTLRGAATVRNLGTDLKYIDQSDPLPRELRLGVAAVQLMDQKLNVSMDYAKQRDIDSQFFMGAEFWPIPFLALRGGYAMNHTESNGIRAGLGLKIKDVSFDYAFSPYGDLGITHRYEMTYRFGTVRPTLTPEMRRMLHSAKVAMAEGRYGEATMLLDSLLRMAPDYSLFKRMIKTAMVGYEKQERLAKNQKPLDLSLLSSKKEVKEDAYETQDLEMLLKMSDDASANAKGSNMLPASSDKNTR